nr:hypothetical protein [Tanacetum cinerariifolium]
MWIEDDTCHPPICPAATCTVPRIQSLAANRYRHVAASYWTAASDVAPPSAPVSVGQRRSTMPDHWSTAVDHDGHRRSMVAVNDGQSTLGHGPVWIRSGPGLDWVWAGSGSGLGRVFRVAHSESATWHKLITLTPGKPGDRALALWVFLVTTDVPEIYMQEFWATTTIHHHSIRFKMNNKKCIIILEYFKEMLHICPRIPNHTFDELPFKEEILEFLRYLGHSGEIKKITDNTQQFGAILPVASGASPPKTKASVRKTQSILDITMPPPTAACIRLSTSAKGKQPAKSSKAKGLSVLSEVALTKAEQMKLATKRSLQQTHISQASGYSADEGTEAKDEDNFDPIFQTPSQVENSDDESHDMNVRGDEGPDAEDDDEELYRDVNINLEGRDIQMIDFVTSMFNPSPDASIDYLFESTPRVDVPITTIVVPLLVTAPTLPPPSIPIMSQEQVKVQVSNILPKIEKTVNEQLEAEVLSRSSNSSKIYYIVAAALSKMELKKILIEKMESNKSIHRSDEQRNLYKALFDAYECDKIILDTYGDTIMLKRRRDDADKDEEPSTGSDRGSKRRREGKDPESTSDPKEKASKTIGKSTEGSKSHQKTTCKSAPAEEPMQTTQDLEEPSHQEFETCAADDRPTAEASQHPKCDIAKQADSRASFNELMDTPIDFSAFLMNQLNVDTLTPELLAGPTYELMKGSCKSLVELEFFLEEVYKETIDQLDWNNPEGQQYLHNLLKPLPLIPNSRGCRVIPFDHFINNDLEYLCGGASSRKYTTSSQASVSYDKYALWGISHWGCKRQQFYGFAVNRESARDVYSKRRIIVVTEPQIVQWHNYKHLDWITVRKDDDKLYKFKEGNLKRLRIQDIQDMLLFLVQGKLTNLTVKERFAFNISLRMFTRSIVIQRRVEDLQLGVEIYQKKLNLTKPDTYRMKYLPQTIWKRSVKERAASMIQAIEKQLKARRIMRSLDKFVGGRLYEGDFRMLQQTK